MWIGRLGVCIGTTKQKTKICAVAKLVIFCSLRYLVFSNFWDFLSEQRYTKCPEFVTFVTFGFPTTLEIRERFL